MKGNSLILEKEDETTVFFGGCNEINCVTISIRGKIILLALKGVTGREQSGGGEEISLLFLFQPPAFWSVFSFQG